VAPLAASAEGVDVDPEVLQHLTTEAPVHIMSSDDYFLRSAAKSFDVVFLDGDHSFEQVSKDFDNTLGVLSDDGSVVLHDTWPESEEHTHEGACGTVYKLAAQLEGDARFNAFTYRRFPGVTVVQQAKADRF
jgi:hypothetical protein